MPKYRRLAFEFHDSRHTQILVHESSALVTEDHEDEDGNSFSGFVYLKLSVDLRETPDPDKGEALAHMTTTQARKVAAALIAICDRFDGIKGKK